MSVIQILLVGIALATAGVDNAIMLEGKGTYKVYVDWVGCPSLLFVDTYPWVGLFILFSLQFFLCFIYTCMYCIYIKSY
jgi:hypothetical protein